MIQARVGCGSGSSLPKRPPIAATSLSADSATIARVGDHQPQSGDQVCHRLLRAYPPASVRILVTPWRRNLFGGETPLEPPLLHVDEMLDQLQRSPARWQAAGPQVFVRQAVDLSDDRRSVVVQVTEQQFLRIAELAARFMHCTSHGDRLCPAVGVVTP